MADGEAVDWSSAEAKLARTSSRAVAENLRAIAAVAETSTRARIAQLGVVEGYRLPLWAWLVVGLATLQVVLGLIGYAIGVPDGKAVSPIVLSLGAISLGTVGLGLVAGAGRDRRTSYLGGALVSAASALCVRGFGSLASRVPLPGELAFLRLGLLPEAFSVLFFWLFVREFPRVVKLSPLERPLAWGVRLAALVGVGGFLANLGAAILNPSMPEAAPILGGLTRNHPWGLYWLGLLGPSLAALGFALARRRDANQDERRRVALLTGGLVVGVAPVVLILIAHYLTVLVGSSGLLADRKRLLLFALLAYAPLLTMPLTAAYAVRTHRALEFAVVVRRAVQRLLARTSLLILTVLPLAGLLVYLYSNRHRSLSALMTGGHGLVLLGLTAGAGLLLQARRLVSRALDRVFFRTQVDLQDILARLGPILRGAQSADELLDHLIAETVGSLQVEAAFFMQGSSEGPFLHAVRGTARPLSRETALVVLAIEDGKPINTDPRDPHSIFPWLPEPERQWVVDSNAALVVPSRDSASGVVGLLGLGPKLSDEPFSKDEHAFLESLSTTVSLAFENHALRGSVDQPRATGASDEPAKECPGCGRVWSAEESACSCGTPAQKAAIPQVLHGKFRLERVLGRGGMGIVYLAEDLTLARRVALKTLPRISAELSLRLRAEARSMAAVTHPNLALIFGAESWRGVPVLVMEHLAGGTLTQRLDQPISPTEVLRLGVTLSGALENMHAQGVLHRDIKPSNIGFTAAGVPKLLDFGLARILDESLGTLPPAPGQRGRSRRAKGPELTRSDHIVGTPLYLPPEALQGQPASPAQDLWGLSMVLYEAIAGRHPLRTPNGLDLKAVGKPLPDVRRFRGDCPTAVAEMFHEALAVEPSRRIVSAAKLRERLAAVAGDGRAA